LLWTVSKELRAEKVKTVITAAGFKPPVVAGFDKVSLQLMKSVQTEVRGSMTQHHVGDAAAAAATATAGVEDSKTECEELVLQITRDAGIGLGMSVAGGVGTTPFRDNDEVQTGSVLFVITVRHLNACPKM